MYAATAVSSRGQFQGTAAKGCSQGRQTGWYIESYSSSLPSSSSLLSLVSLISAIYKAPFSRIAFCTCRHITELNLYCVFYSNATRLIAIRAFLLEEDIVFMFNLLF
jgi:hypothetical protein